MPWSSDGYLPSCVDFGLAADLPCATTGVSIEGWYDRIVNISYASWTPVLHLLARLFDLKDDGCSYQMSSAF